MKWYVYELCDPDGTRFYVGKGSGNRMRQHLTNSHSDLVNSRIARIRKTGRDPVVRALAYFYNEIDALRHEYELIRTGVNLLNKASAKVKPRIVSLFKTIGDVLMGKVVQKDIKICLDMIANIPAELEQFADEYHALAQILMSKVDKSGYAH